MDFSFSEDQLEIRSLARGILEREVTHERLKEIETGEEWFDPELWATLAKAGLLGLFVPGDIGGMGFGIEEACVLLQEIGRAVAPVPVLPTLVLGALPIAALGTPVQKKDWLLPVAAGKVLLTGALADASAADPERPATRARRDGRGWLIDGEKLAVPAAHLAARIVVPAATEEGVGLFLVDPRARGVSLTRQVTSTGEPLFRLVLSRVRADPADLLGESPPPAGAGPGRWLHERALVATCATQIGVSERALEITSAYVRERLQFGVPIGSFQAVQQRAADCYVDLEAMRWVTWRAAWKLGRGLDATRETAVAKFWAAEAGARIAAAAQHLHGGIGVDVDYPIHRYFLWSKALELCLGSAAPHLARLGREMAESWPDRDQSRARLREPNAISFKQSS
jgi:alkylation response protein AidB-like acyl-CoA dehydrogenase